jgi:predicted peptidase
MITRREAFHLLGAASMAAWLATRPVAQAFMASTAFAGETKADASLTLAPGAPSSPERLALIETFKQQSNGLEQRFEGRTYKNGDLVMPYRLFRPQTASKAPLVMYLHGSGGLGDDNEKQLELGNTFGTRVWLLPENQKHFPCYVLAPQTNNGWASYDLSQQGPAKPLPGLGEGSRLALEIVDKLLHEFPQTIDANRIYVTGQSMGGAGVWNMITHRPGIFAAAAVCCGSVSAEDGTGAINLPLWNFHGDSDQTVPVSVSRERIAARRKAGGHPLATEYAGVDHNVWQWAYTEPALVKWIFAQHRS